MIPFFKRIFHALFFDEQSFTRWMRGGLNAFSTFLGSVVVTILPFTSGNFSDVITIIQSWTFNDWAWRIGVAFIAFIPGAILAGQKNPTIEELDEKLKELRKAKEEQDKKE